MAGLNIYQPTQSLQQPRGTSTPQGNTYKAREVNVGRIQGQFSGGPAIVSGVGEGLQGLARGLDKWANVLEEQERQKQTFEAMDEINQARDRQRAMFEQMDQMTGEAGIAAPYLMEKFYDDERKYFEEKGTGDFQKMIYARFLGSEREQGLDKAVAHRTAQLENYEQSVMAGDQAQFEMVANDPYSSPEDVTRAAIPLAQRQMAYMRKKGLDPRAAAHEVNKNWRNGMRTNVINRLTGLMETDPAEARRIIGGQPQSSRLPQNVSALADKIGAAKGVDPALLKALIMAESSGNAGAVSKVGARGLMQLMPGTARDLGVNPDDPEQNVRGGAEYISRMLKKYNGNLKHALMAYNWGPGNMDRWLQRGGKGEVPGETQKYVRKVMADYNLQKGGGRAAGGGQLIQPVKGFTKISSGYGNRNTGIKGASTFHEAIDIPAPIGTPVQATIGGTVSTATFKGKNGNYMVIDGDDGDQHYYLHLNNFAAGLQPGQRVEQGQEIAAVGNSGTLDIGPHLDYRIKRKGKFINPAEVLDGQGQSVRLAGNTLAAPGEVVSDAYGVAEPDDPLEMALPAAEINPGSSGDWIFGDDAALAYEFLTGEDWATLRKTADQSNSKAFLEANQVRLINGEMPEVQAELDQRLRDGEISAATYEQVSKDMAYIGERGIKAAVKAEEQSYDEKYRQLFEEGLTDISQPEFMAKLRDSGLYQRDQKFIQSLVMGQTEAERTAGKPYRERAENLIRMAIIEGDVSNQKELQGLMSQFTGLFSFDDVEKYRGWLEGEMKHLAGRADEWLDINADIMMKIPAYAKAKSETEKNVIAGMIKARGVQVAASLGVGRDDPRLDQIMTRMVTEKAENDQLLYLTDQPDLYMWDLAAEDRRDSLVKRKIEQNGEEDTPSNRIRAQQSSDSKKPFRATMAPGSEKWPGRGEIKISGLGKNVSRHGEDAVTAGNAHNVDPEFLIALAYSAWRVLPYGERADSDGLIKMSPEEAAALGVVDPKDPRDNFRGLARRVAERLEANGDDYERVIDDLIQDEKTRKCLRLTYQNRRAPHLNEL